MRDVVAHPGTGKGGTLLLHFIDEETEAQGVSETGRENEN